MQNKRGSNGFPTKNKTEVLKNMIYENVKWNAWSTCIKMFSFSLKKTEALDKFFVVDLYRQ